MESVAYVSACKKEKENQKDAPPVSHLYSNNITYQEKSNNEVKWEFYVSSSEVVYPTNQKSTKSKYNICNQGRF